MTDLTPKELLELKAIRNDLFLLSEEEALPRAVRERLFSMSVVLRRICGNHGARVVSPSIRIIDGIMDEWPEFIAERWEAVK